MKYTVLSFSIMILSYFSFFSKKFPVEESTKTDLVKSLMSVDDVRQREIYQMHYRNSHSGVLGVPSSWANHLFEQKDGKFNVMHGKKFSCGAYKIGSTIKTPSLDSALDICLGSRECSIVMRLELDMHSFHHLHSNFLSLAGDTIFCAGFVSIEDSFEGIGWVSAVRKGCDMPTHEIRDSHGDLQDNADIACYERDFCGFCNGSRAFEVISCGSEGMHSNKCSECPSGACPFLMGSVDWKFAEHVIGMSRHISKSHSQVLRLYNPAFLISNDESLLLMRASDQSRCRGEWVLPTPVDHFNSALVLCWSTQDLLSIDFIYSFSDCRLFYEENQIIGLFLPQYDLHPKFIGLEDARGILVGGVFHIIASLTLAHKTEQLSTPKLFFSRLVLIPLCEHRLDVKSLVVLYLSEGDPTCIHDFHEDDTVLNQKNWIFLREASESSIFFIVNLYPYTVASCNISSGCCKIIRSYFSTKLPSLIGYRGGAITSGITEGLYHILVHEQSKFPHFSRAIYSHKIVTVNMTTFELLQVSVPFRLPSLLNSNNFSTFVASEDIQFGIGIFRRHDEVIISYGVTDCISSIAKFKLKEFQDMKFELFDPFHDVIEKLKDSGTHVRWEGPFRSAQSFAYVNRELYAGIGSKLQDVSFSILDTALSTDIEKFPDNEFAFNILNNNIDDVVSSLGSLITIRNMWPINWNPPLSPVWIPFFAWEFYSIPEAWVNAFNFHVREVWVPTTFVKNGVIESGVDGNLIHVIPHGVDKINCYAKKNALREGKIDAVNSSLYKQIKNSCGVNSFIFLFSGGLLYRKAPEIVIEAFASYMSSINDACLVIHSMYWDAEVFTLVTSLLDAVSSSLNIVLLSTQVTQEAIDDLFAISDVLVHPSRSEGFGLGVAEAMACGLSVITTSDGAVSDFVSTTNAFLIDANFIYCNLRPCHVGTETLVFGEVMSRPPIWLDIMATSVGNMMVHVYNHRDEALQRAQRAYQMSTSQLTWASAAGIAAERLREIVGKNE